MKTIETKELTLKVKNFSKRKETEIYSDIFLAAGHRWRIMVYPNGKRGIPGFLAAYVQFVDWSTKPWGWTVPAIISLTLVDQLNGTSSVRDCSATNFHGNSDNSWGFNYLVSQTDLHDPQKG
ncbi:unnamed protein product [Linum tenue]|uniref:MATH domain-containing protein n=1 Tax=Linum tenue TaxID=586396 RepID=A0AAV0KDY6_9ROSI|nr:unnamed protein product [Linum tenue]